MVDIPDSANAILQAGVAVHNAGFYHAAHDAWEERWLSLEDGDERDFLQGLIQFTAAVYHARERNWKGTIGLATSAHEYLAGLPDDYRGVNIGEVRTWLKRLEDDPELIDREPVLYLSYEGRPLSLSDLEYPAVAIAAPLVAEGTGYDSSILDRASGYALADLADESVGSPFVTLVLDFIADDEQRPVVAKRLEEHVERRRAREADVEGLFD